MKSLITDFKDHPDWCKQEDGVSSIEGRMLGDIVAPSYNPKDVMKIIHISRSGFCRCMISGSNASVTHRAIILNKSEEKFI